MAYSFSQTVASRHTTGACCPDSGGNSLKTSADSLTITLSDEDLDADAISRLLAGAGGTWGAWIVTGDGSGSTCLAPSCCLAQWQNRTTGFSIAYNEAQFRCNNFALSLDPSTNYTIKVNIYRRVWGTVGAYTLFETLEFPVTTDLSGNFPQFDGDVPNAIGFETYSGNAFAVRTP